MKGRGERRVFRSKKRNKSEFGKRLFAILEKRGLEKCESNAHRMVFCKDWHFRIANERAKWRCVDCNMELFVELCPPKEYAKVHGTAYYLKCVKLV